MVRGLTEWALAVRGAPGACWRRLIRSPRLRVLRLLWETSPGLLVMLGLFIVADGFLPIVALVALGRAVGHIPAAVTYGLGSASGHSLLIALAFGTAAYALSLLRSPAEDLLSAHASAVMSAGMQRRLARAVCAPVGVEHLEDSAVLDQLSAASGELSTSGPADAPMALASAFGDRLSGFIACVVLATFRWYIGLLFFVGWSLLRPPLRRLLAERALLVRRATPELRHSWYYLGCAYRPAFAKEMRVFGLRPLDPGPAPRQVAGGHGTALAADAPLQEPGPALRPRRRRDVRRPGRACSRWRPGATTSRWRRSRSCCRCCPPPCRWAG